MTIFLWFLLGLWVGGSLGFLVFACLQVSRDGERAADAGVTRRDRWLPTIGANSVAALGTSCVVHRTDSLQQH